MKMFNRVVKYALDSNHYDLVAVLVYDGYIYQGTRCPGKTTLLLQIGYKIDRDKERNKRFIPVF